MSNNKKLSLIIGVLLALGLCAYLAADEPSLQVTDVTRTTVERTAGESSDATSSTQGSGAPSNDSQDGNASSADSSSAQAPESPTNKKTETTTAAKGRLVVRFIDVGQADATLIENNGHYMLVDGGNKADAATIYTVLAKQGVKTLDMAVGTHPHEDHIGGLPAAYHATRVKHTWCSETSYDTRAFRNFAQAAREEGASIRVPKVGSRFTLGSASVKVLSVDDGYDSRESSIVLRVTFGKTSFLLTGDADRDTEQAMLGRGASLRADVLKVGHHGSATSTSYRFLRAVRPTYGVISVGKGNSYGHPTEETLSRLRDAGVKLYRTDMQGDIVCSSDGKKITIKPSRNAAANVFKAGSRAQSSSSWSYSSSSSSSSGSSASSNGKVRYIINTSTEKFHYPDCSAVRRMAEHNKMAVNETRSKVIAMGYSPCGICKP